MGCEHGCSKAWPMTLEEPAPDAAPFGLLRFSRLCGLAPDVVRDCAQEQGMEVSELVDNVVYASAPAASSHPVILAKWLVQFHFDRDRLRDIHVERGLIGP